MNKGRILVVDDDQFYQEFCRDILEEEGYYVRTAYTGEEGLEILKREKFDIMLADLVMPGIDGLAVLEGTKQINPYMDVIIMTGYASVESAVQCLKSGASDYLTKPLNPEELKITIKRTIELRHLFDENFELRSLLNLYESCQRINLCLEMEKLYGLSLDAVLRGLSGDMGMMFFRDDGAWSIKAHRGLEEDEAESMLEDLLKKDLKEIPGRVVTIDDPLLGKEGGAGHHLRVNSGLIIPMHLPGDNQGMLAIFRKGDSQRFDRMDLGTARFLSEQIHLSFENSLKYQDSQRLVFVDDLSGLFNTRYLDMALQNELKRAKRYKKHLSLLFIDLDHFKDVNDNYGHLVGSKVLIETAEVLKECVRDIDVVVRYGGDEFIMILVETDREGAAKVAERVRASMEAKVMRIHEGLEIRITCCVGVATFPDDAESKTDLIHLADKAMYRGKQTTRNVVYAAGDLEDTQ